jgi:hypothetical protein
MTQISDPSRQRDPMERKNFNLVTDPEGFALRVAPASRRRSLAPDGNTLNRAVNIPKTDARPFTLEILMKSSPEALPQ